MSSTQILDLTKKFELNLTKAGFDQISVMRTRLAVDSSSSMDSLYRNGWVKHAIELFLGAAGKFDDNGELEFCFFNTGVKGAQSVDLNNYQKMQIVSAGGGTHYVPPLEELVDLNVKKTGIFSRIFGGSAPKQEDPVYLGFITDGEPNDRRETLAFLEKMQKTRNFVQFIAIGRGIDESFLKQLGKYDNTSYIVIDDPRRSTDETFYEALANQKLLAWTKSLKSV